MMLKLVHKKSLDYFTSKLHNSDESIVSEQLSLMYLQHHLTLSKILGTHVVSIVINPSVGLSDALLHRGSITFTMFDMGL